MDISVVIPSYNRADLLPDTLAAVLAQTHPPSQIIVVDDGSHDHTMAVLAGYAPRVTAIRIDNSGSIVARNAGLRLATAPLVAFCDSDDLWRPDFLARMAALWQAEPRTCVAYANFRIVRDGVWSAGTKFDEAPSGFWNGLRPLGHDAAVFDQPVVERLVRFQPFFPSACVADRVAMLQAGGWDEGVGRTVGDDFGTVLRLGELQPFGVLSAAAGRHPQASRELFRQRPGHEPWRRGYSGIRAGIAAFAAAPCQADPRQHRPAPNRRVGQRVRGSGFSCRAGHLSKTAPRRDPS